MSISTKVEITFPYKLIAVDDSFLNTGETYLKIQVSGLSKTFTKPLKEIYNKGWLEKFSSEDVAHIALLYALEIKNNQDIIQQFPARTHSGSNHTVILGMLYSAFLILSNLTAFKIVTFFGLHFTAALIFFPLTYLFDDVITEVYGFKMSRRIIWLGLFSNTIVMLGTMLAVYLPSADFWHDQMAFQTVFSLSFRIFIASSIAYFFGEFINSIILAKLKVLTSGKHFWIRIISSSCVGVMIDSTLFCFIAFAGTMPTKMIFSLIGTFFIFKISYEILALPLTYRIANYLKRIDKIDVFDTNTSFNPFSLSVF